jgi:asparagine synthase (glutamine-hydrolysing)
MWNTNRKACISYNGEVYNFRELRAELERDGYVFQSRSDTEVVLNAYLAWGTDCLSRLNGMFAFAIWDAAKQKLVLARDRYGTKPLYYSSAPNRFVFASEVKALLATDIPVKVDLEALSEYFTFQNLFTDNTLFAGIKTLPSGTVMEIDCRGEQLATRTAKYWDYSHDTINISEAEAADELRKLFVQAVKRQLVSAVPVGGYLSGGMDTGSIVTVASSQIERIHTFTCGFDMHAVSGLELGYDEREYAEYLANLVKSEHYEAVLHAGDMEAVMPDLVWHLEDLRVGQCYPDWYATKLASRFVKVVLSGTGGDELFAGYPWRYFRGAQHGDYVRDYYDFWQRLIPNQDREWFYTYPVYAAIKDSDPFTVFKGVFGDAATASQADRVKAALIFEMRTFLHGLLVVTDKISMAHSLETRVPFLDNDLVDFALSLPVEHNLKRLAADNVDENDVAKPKRYYQKTNEGKHLLRLAMRSLIPQEVLEREKQGFSAPDGTWFRGESVDYVRRLLLDHKARIFDYINYPYVRKKIDEHSSGKKNNRLLIWSLLCFEWWLHKFVG